jgi:hypothetical protein
VTSPKITFWEKGLFIQCGFMILTNKCEKYVETRRGIFYISIKKKLHLGWNKLMRKSLGF